MPAKTPSRKRTAEYLVAFGAVPITIIEHRRRPLVQDGPRVHRGAAIDQRAARHLSRTPLADFRRRKPHTDEVMKKILSNLGDLDDGSI